MIDLINVSLQFTGKYLFSDLNLRINSGDKIALVGANGSGKSSLLKIISGEIEPESGKVQKQKRTTVGYLPQEQVVHRGKTILAETSSALVNIQYLLQKQKEISENLSNPNLSAEEQNDLIHQMGDVQEKLEALDSYSSESRVKKILAGLGFEENEFERLTDEFSGGWQMRIALAKILVAQNDILLFDEPTNHLDLDSLQWLIDFIQKYKGAFVIVSHDRHFINQTTDKTLEFYNSKFHSFSGNYESFMNYKEERDSLLIHQQQQQQKKIKETQKFIERFRYKATKAKQVQSRIKQLEKIEIIELPDSENETVINFPEPPKSGTVNMELGSISKSYSKKLVLSNVDLRINRGDKIAFVGPNGAGKTTLAKIIAGNILFDDGERKIGYNTIISFYSQDVADNLELNLDALESVENIDPNKTLAQLRSVLGSFLFKGEDVFKKVSVLSGGEKSRLALAKILLTKANFIILDEPTNHLDFASKKVLQQALIKFPGSLILVSHDIEFLKPLVNRVVEIRKNKIKILEGGIEYYLFKRENALIDDHSKKLEEDLNDNNDDSKKQKKREEAELRNEKYNATKNLKKEIQELEEKIAKFEREEKEVGKILMDSKTYDDPKKIKKMNEEFLNVKSELKICLARWEDLSSQLEKIEKKYS